MLSLRWLLSVDPVVEPEGGDETDAIAKAPRYEACEVRRDEVPEGGLGDGELWIPGCEVSVSDLQALGGVRPVKGSR